MEEALNALLKSHEAATAQAEGRIQDSLVPRPVYWL